MANILFSTLTQTLPFLPLGLAISASFTLMRTTDMTLDGSFVLGAGIFARALEMGINPIVATLLALLSGACAGIGVSMMQAKQKIDPLLAGVLATFILGSLTLVLMGRPNISLLTQTTLFSGTEDQGYLLVAGIVVLTIVATFTLLNSKFGLLLRGIGDNPNLLLQLGKPLELYRASGFALTNMLAALAGCLTAQTVGYADITSGFGMTLSALGAVIVGQAIVKKSLRIIFLRTKSEFGAVLCGALLYFFIMNGLLRLSIDPIYLKMILGLILFLFLRGAAMRRLA